MRPLIQSTGGFYFAMEAGPTLPVHVSSYGSLNSYFFKCKFGKKLAIMNLSSTDSDAVPYKSAITIID